MLRKSLVTSFLAFGLTFAPALAAAGEGAECTQGHKLTLQTVVDKHLKAMGGKERLKAVKNVRVTSVFKEGDAVVMTSTMQRARPNLVRYDSDKNGAKLTKIFDGQQAWMMEGSAAPQRLDKEKTSMMAEGAAFDDALLDPKAQGYALKLDGMEEVNGAPTFKVVLTRGTTTEVRFIDPQSFLEVRRTYTGTHEGKPVDKVLTFSDYREVDGIMLNHRTQWAADGKQGERVTQSADYDAPMDAATFKPATPRS
jgi:zinc protease